MNKKFLFVVLFSSCIVTSGSASAAASKYVENSQACMVNEVKGTFDRASKNITGIYDDFESSVNSFDALNYGVNQLENDFDSMMDIGENYRQEILDIAGDAEDLVTISTYTNKLKTVQRKIDEIERLAQSNASPERLERSVQDLHRMATDLPDMSQASAAGDRVEQKSSDLDAVSNKINSEIAKLDKITEAVNTMNNALVDPVDEVLESFNSMFDSMDQFNELLQGNIEIPTINYALSFADMEEAFQTVEAVMQGYVVNDLQNLIDMFGIGQLQSLQNAMFDGVSAVQEDFETIQDVYKVIKNVSGFIKGDYSTVRPSEIRSAVKDLKGRVGDIGQYQNELDGFADAVGEFDQAFGQVPDKLTSLTNQATDINGFIDAAMGAEELAPISGLLENLQLGEDFLGIFAQDMQSADGEVDEIISSEALIETLNLDVKLGDQTVFAEKAKEKQNEIKAFTDGIFEEFSPVYNRLESAESSLRDLGTLTESVQSGVDNLTNIDGLTEAKTALLDKMVHMPVSKVQNLTSSIQGILNVKEDALGVLGKVGGLSVDSALGKVENMVQTYSDLPGMFSRMSEVKQVTGAYSDAQNLVGTIQNLGPQAIDGIASCLGFSVDNTVNYLQKLIEDYMVEQATAFVYDTYGKYSTQIPFLVLPPNKGAVTQENYRRLLSGNTDNLEADDFVEIDEDKLDTAQDDAQDDAQDWYDEYNNEEEAPEENVEIDPAFKQVLDNDIVHNGYLNRLEVVLATITDLERLIEDLNQESYEANVLPEVDPDAPPVEEGAPTDDAVSQETTPILEIDPNADLADRISDAEAELEDLREEKIDLDERIYDRVNDLRQDYNSQQGDIHSSLGSPLKFALYKSFESVEGMGSEGFTVLAMVAATKQVEIPMITTDDMTGDSDLSFRSETVSDRLNLDYQGRMPLTDTYGFDTLSAWEYEMNEGPRPEADFGIRWAHGDFESKLWSHIPNAEYPLPWFQNACDSAGTGVGDGLNQKITRAIINGEDSYQDGYTWERDTCRHRYNTDGWRDGQCRWWSWKRVPRMVQITDDQKQQYDDMVSSGTRDIMLGKKEEGVILASVKTEDPFRGQIFQGCWYETLECSPITVPFIGVIGESCSFLYQVKPGCDVTMEYKEPVAHVEVVERNATSQMASERILGLIDFYHARFAGGENLLDLGLKVDDWGVGGRDRGKNLQARVYGISPMARTTSNLGLLKGPLTMACKTAEVLENEPDGVWPYLAAGPVPTPEVGAIMTLPKAISRADWAEKWYQANGQKPEGERMPPMVGTNAYPINMLFMSEKHKTKWNPRSTPYGTPAPLTDTKVGDWKNAGKTLDELGNDILSSIVPAVDGGERKLLLEHIFAHKKSNGQFGPARCGVGGENATSGNVCIDAPPPIVGPGWGSLFPRTGQFYEFDPRYPLKQHLLVAYRAFDVTLEQGMFNTSDDSTDNMKVKAVEAGGVNYSDMEMNIDWPVQTDRFRVGDYPKGTITEWVDRNISKGEVFDGGMVTSLWKDTKCCVRSCCEVYPFDPRWTSVDEYRFCFEKFPMGPGAANFRCNIISPSLPLAAAHVPGRVIKTKHYY